MYYSSLLPFSLNFFDLILDEGQQIVNFLLFILHCLRPWVFPSQLLEYLDLQAGLALTNIPDQLGGGLPITGLIVIGRVNNQPHLVPTSTSHLLQNPHPTASEDKGRPLALKRMRRRVPVLKSRMNVFLNAAASKFTPQYLRAHQIVDTYPHRHPKLIYLLTTSFVNSQSEVAGGKANQFRSGIIVYITFFYYSGMASRIKMELKQSCSSPFLQKFTGKVGQINKNGSFNHEFRLLYDKTYAKCKTYILEKKVDNILLDFSQVRNKIGRRFRDSLEPSTPTTPIASLVQTESFCQEKSKFYIEEALPRNISTSMDFKDMLDKLTELENYKRIR